MNAYIVAGKRSAVGKAKKGGFRFTRPDDLAADVIKNLVLSVKGLENEKIDDLIVGNAVPEAEQGMQMARYISLLALSKDVPGMIINRYCGSGLEAIHLACARVHAGTADCIIAGGTESMSMVPMTGYKSALNYIDTLDKMGFDLTKDSTYDVGFNYLDNVFKKKTQQTHH